MPRNKMKHLNVALNVFSKSLKFFGTSVLNVLTLRTLGTDVHSVRTELLVLCGSIAATAGCIEGLNSKYHSSKKIAKIYKILLKSERFLDFIMLFRMLDTSLYSLIGQEAMAAGVSAGITIPFASWRAYKSKRYWIENPITVFLSNRVGNSRELIAFPLPRPIDSHRFSTQGFSEFKRLYSTVIDTESTTLRSDAELLHDYFNLQMKEHSLFNRYVLMDALSYGAEVAGIVGYTMYIISSIFRFSNPVLNLGVAAFFFVAGILAGYKIEKIKDLLFDIYTSDFTRDHELQDNIHELLVKLYADVTANVRRFAKVAEFLKNVLAVFIGLQFVYAEIGDTSDINDYYTLTCAILSILVGINSIYSVQRQQDEMLSRTGVKDTLERLERSESSAVAETEYVPPAAQAQTITTPPKGEKGDAAGQPLFQGNGSPESSVSSSDSADSPPRSLPSRSPPPLLDSSVETSSVRSAPGDLLMERRETTHKKPKGWFDGWSSFFGSRRGERVEGLRIPLVPPDERSADPEIGNGMLLKPA